MRLSTLAAALLVATTVGPAYAQEVQGSFSIALTAQFSFPTGNGSRIVRFRMGTKDVVQVIKEDLGITAPGGKLVQRRPIEELDLPGDLWLIIGNEEYLDPDPPIAELPVDLPESFDAEVEAVKLRNGIETAITVLGTSAFAGGDLATDGLEMTLIGTHTTSFRLLTQNGVDVGYVVRSASDESSGGMLLDVDGFGVQPAIVHGTIRLGPEKPLP